MAAEAIEETPVEVPQARQRDTALDQMKGLLILLVVFSHLVSYAAPVPVTQRWYGDLRDVLYLFHMPAFFFVSGIVFAISAGRIKPGGRGPMLLRRADRLLVPYLVMGPLILLGKYAAHFFIQVDNFQAGDGLGATFATGMYQLFIDTDHSPANSTWFLVSYFICLCVAIPVSSWRHGSLAMLALGAVLFVVPGPHVLYLDRLFTHLVFFALGWWLWTWNPATRERFVDRAGWPLVLLLFALIFPVLRDMAPRIVWFAIFGASASILILAAMRQYPSRLLTFVGGSTMAIYILNTPFIGAVRGAFVKLGAYDSAFPLYLVVSFAVAIGVPILLRELVVRRSPALSRYLG